MLDVCVELCLGLMTGIMSMVLAQAAHLVNWRLMRSVRTCEAVQKCKISLSVSVRRRLTQCSRLLVLLAPVPAQPWVLCPRWAIDLVCRGPTYPRRVAGCHQVQGQPAIGPQVVFARELWPQLSPAYLNLCTTPPPAPFPPRVACYHP